MRYILDTDGYVAYASVGNEIECDGVSCTLYSGTVPEEYSSIEDWMSEANINAYKIVDGNLVLDSARLAYLKAKEKSEENDNRHVTAKELYDLMNIQSNVTEEEFTAQIKGSNLLVIDGAGEQVIPKMTIKKGVNWNDISDKTWNELSAGTWDTIGKGIDVVSQVEIISSNKNIVPCLVPSQTINGVEVTQNEDYSFTLDGTATADTEITLAGTTMSTEALFCMRLGTEFVKSGLRNLSLKLYDYDGTDRTLVHSGENGTITPTETYRVTHATLSIPNGTTLSNVTISPQIEIGSTATEYVPNKRDYKKITASMDSGDILTIDNGTVKLNDSTIDYGSNVKTFKEKCVLMVSANASISLVYYLPNVIESLKHMKISADQIDLAGYTTIESKDGFGRYRIEFIPNDDNILDATEWSGDVVRGTAIHEENDQTDEFETFSITGNGDFKTQGQVLVKQGMSDAIYVYDDTENETHINADGISTPNLSIANQSMTDFIVETGTKNNWYYEKYSNGIVKMWYKATSGTFYVNTSSNGAYVSNSWTYSYPIALTNIYDVRANCTNGAAWRQIELKISEMSASGFTAHMVSEGSFRGLTITYSYEVIGTWK